MLRAVTALAERHGQRTACARIPAVYVQGGPSSGVVPGPGQRELLAALANGRRTARDVAFALGRGVYAVTLEIDRMRGADLVLIDPGTVRVPPYLGLAGAAGDPYPPPAPARPSRTVTA